MKEKKVESGIKEQELKRMYTALFAGTLYLYLNFVKNPFN